MARIDDVMDSIGAVIRAATQAVPGMTFVQMPKGNTVTVQPGQIIKGDPLVPEMVTILGQGSGNWQITMFPRGQAKSATRFSPLDGPIIVKPVIDLTAAVTPGVITLGGTVGTDALFIHTVINGQGDAFVQTTPSQTLPSVASAISAAINGLDLPGVSASAASGVITTVGVHSLKCNVVGGGGTVSYEVARRSRMIDVSIWATDPYTRSILVGAIEPFLGGTLQTFLQLPDTTGVYVDAAGDSIDDMNQSGYSLFIGHLYLDVDYGIMATYPTAQLGAIENQIEPSRAQDQTLWVG